MNKRISLWRKDKIPYGSKVAFDNLKYLFPDAEVTIVKTAPDASSGRDDTTANLKTVYLILAPEVIPDNGEILDLLNMASSGCHVFISAFHIGKGLLDSLRAGMHTGSSLEREDSLQLDIYLPDTSDTLSFAYPGYASGNYFTKLDTTITAIAGTTNTGKANFIQFRYTSGGTLTLQIEPFALTNFFLLHKQNKVYYDKIFSYLPEELTTIEWDDYYRNKQAAHNNFSALSFLLKQPAFRMAIFLVLLLCCLAVLTEMKRRQRIVPVIEPLRNTSIDFVKTVGQLYFQQKDHRNLAQKMIVQFGDHVRSRYNITTAVLDEGFIDKLSYKSSFDRVALADIVQDMKRIEEAKAISEEALFKLAKKLEHFYKNRS